MSTHTSLPEGGTAGRTGDRKACHRERCCSAGRQCRYHLSSLVLGWRVGPVTPFVLLLAARFASHHAMTCYPSVLVEPGWQTSACMGRTGARTYDVVALVAQLGSLPGLRVLDATQLMSLEFAQAMLASGGHICMVKGLISALCLHLHGGVFLDLDNLVVGRDLPLFRGHAFGAEPVKTLPPQRHPNRTLQVDSVMLRVNLGLLAGPRKSGILAELARALCHNWRHRITKYCTGQRVAAVTPDRADVSTDICPP